MLVWFDLVPEGVDGSETVIHHKSRSSGHQRMLKIPKGKEDSYQCSTAKITRPLSTNTEREFVINCRRKHGLF